MTREQAIEAAYGRTVSQTEGHSLVSEMNREMNAFVDELTAASGLHKHEAYYFFFGRLGTNYEDYPFNWEPFRSWRAHCCAIQRPCQS